MLIKIWVDDAADVAGHAELGEEEAQPFAGWLQLLRILADALPGPGGAALQGETETFYPTTGESRG